MKQPSYKLLSELFSSDISQVKEEQILTNLGLDSLMDTDGTFFIARCSAGHSFTWRFHRSCFDFIGYSKSYLEDPRNTMFTKRVIVDVFNSFKFDVYLQNLINFSMKDSMMPFNQIVDLKKKDETRKVIVNVIPLYKNKAEVVWLTFVRDVGKLDGDKYILNDSLIESDTCFIKFVNRDGKLKYNEDDTVRRFFKLPENVSSPMSIVNDYLKNFHPDKFNKQNVDLRRLINGEVSKTTLKFDWKYEGHFRIVEVTTFIVNIIDFDELEQVPVNQIECISIIQDITRSEKLVRKLRRRNYYLENTVEMKDIYMGYIDRRNESISYFDERTIKKLGLIEHDYKKIADDVYKVDWKFIFNNYFDLTKDEFSNYLAMNSRVFSGVDKEYTSVLVGKSHQDGITSFTTYRRTIKRLSNDEILIVLEDISSKDENATKDLNVKHILEDANTLSGIGIVHFNDDASDHLYISEGVLNLFGIDGSEVFKYSDFIEVISSKAILTNGQDLKTALQKIKTDDFNGFSEVVKLLNEKGKYLRLKCTKAEDNSCTLIVQDATEEYLRVEKELRSAHQDALTSFGNRNAFKYDFDLGKLSNKFIILLNFIDLKFINENYSYLVGDMFLKELTKVLASIDENARCYRFDGSDFIFVVDDYSYFLADKLLEKLTKYYYIEDIPHKTDIVFSSLSLKEFSNIDYPTLISYLNFAKTEVSKLGRNKYQEVDSALVNRFERRRILFSEFKDGLDLRTVVPLYQPFVDLERGKVIGFESLARIVINGNIYTPDEFIVVLENCNQITELDVLMFNYSVRLGVELHAKNLLPDDYISSSNFSAKGLSRINIDELDSIVEMNGASKNNIEIEITEQVLIDDDAMLVIDELCKRGYKVSIDDFSAGYASLKYISSIDATTLKIDRDLVKNIVNNSSKQNIIYRAVVELARSLNLTTISEGIETKDQLKILEDLGTKIVQGYYFSKPTRKENFVDVIKKINK